MINVLPGGCLSSLLNRLENGGGRVEPPCVEDHGVKAASFIHGLLNEDAGREAGRGGRLVNLCLESWIIWWRENLREGTRDRVHESGALVEGRAGAKFVPWALVKHGVSHGRGERWEMK